MFFLLPDKISIVLFSRSTLPTLVFKLISDALYTQINIVTIVYGEYDE